MWERGRSNGAANTGHLPELPRGHPCRSDMRIRPELNTGEPCVREADQHGSGRGRRKGPKPWAPRWRQLHSERGPGKTHREQSGQGAPARPNNLAEHVEKVVAHHHHHRWRADSPPIQFAGSTGRHQYRLGLDLCGRIGSQTQGRRRWTRFRPHPPAFIPASGERTKGGMRTPHWTLSVINVRRRHRSCPRDGDWPHLRRPLSCW
jgi:hypothetical protein